jgi:protoheme IX farnesyltransferase
MPLAWYRRLTLFTAFAVWALLVLGGVVRVTGSGRGCGDDWPLCNGRLFPPLEFQPMVEWNHRLFALLVGWLMIATTGATVLWFRQRRRLFWLSLLGAAFYFGQAILGAITVWLHLDHKWVAAHMGNSMLLLGSMILLAVYTRVPQGDPRARGMSPGDRGLWRLTLATLVWTFVAMFTGSAVIGFDANLSCSAWPHCADGQPLPATTEQWVNMGHRLAVGFADVLMLALAVLIWRRRQEDRRLLWTAHALALVYVTQVFVGAFTIWTGAPASLRGAHLALAAASWGALVVLAAFVRLGPSVPADGEGAGSAPGGPRRPVRERRRLLPEVARTYLSLTKPRIIPLLLVPTVASMLIAAAQQGSPSPLLPLILWTMLGGTLATAGAHAINQCLDRDLDARMRRTKARAVVTGRVEPRQALGFGIALTVLAFFQLWLTVNLPAAALAIAGNLFYVFVYTMWLKRTTVQNIVIGGAAGAVPPLVGWAAVTGGVGLPAVLFFAIIFFWTPAHFWSLALVRQEEYRNAGVPMLPVVKGEAATRRGILQYAVILLAVTLLPFATRSLGLLYLTVAAGLGALFVYRAVGLLRDGSPARAWGLFKYSNMYLALLYLAMVVDRIIALQ